MAHLRRCISMRSAGWFGADVRPTAEKREDLVVLVRMLGTMMFNFFPTGPHRFEIGQWC